MIIRYSSYYHHFLTHQSSSEVLCRTHFYCIFDKTLLIHLFSYIILYFPHACAENIFNILKLYLLSL